MNRLVSILLFLIISTNTVLSQQIILDEDVNDWSEINTEFIDPMGDSNGLDVIRFKVHNDNLFLYFFLEFNSEFDLQENNDLVLYIDTDNNPETGTSRNGIGYDFEFTFGQRSGSFNNSTIGPYNVGLIGSPTVTSTTFEIKIDLNSQIGGASIFNEPEISFFFESASANEFAPDEGNPAVYELNLNSNYEPTSFQIGKSSNTDIRVLSYNVRRDALFNPSLKDEYERIISAIQPDIIGFQEIYNNSGEQAANLMEDFLQSAEGENWYSGDTGTDNLVVSRYPIINQKTIEGNSAYLLDAGDQYIFTIVAHPPCCGNDDGRQWEIDAFMGFLRDSQNGEEFDIPENTPIIIMGDMNLVGLRRQQTTLITGDLVYENDHGPDFNPDWDGTALDDAKPENPGLPTTFTWYSPNSSFGAGRLDYMVFSGSVLEMTNTFSLHTPSLDPDTLQFYGLESQDTIEASDHIPVVADFKFKTVTSTEVRSEIPKNFELGQNYPNPFNPYTVISYTLTVNSFVTLKVFDTLGHEVTVLENGLRNAGTHTVSFDASNLSSGIYFYRLEVDGQVQNKQMILVK